MKNSPRSLAVVHHLFLRGVFPYSVVVVYTVRCLLRSNVPQQGEPTVLFSFLPFPCDCRHLIEFVSERRF